MACSLYPLSSSVLCVYGYLNLLKAIQKGKKSSEGFEVTPGNRTRDFPCKGFALTNCANPSSYRTINLALPIVLLRKQLQGQHLLYAVLSTIFYKHIFLFVDQTTHSK